MNKCNKLKITNTDRYIHVYLDNKHIFCTNSYKEFKMRIGALAFSLMGCDKNG